MTKFIIYLYKIDVLECRFLIKKIVAIGFSTVLAGCATVEPKPESNPVYDPDRPIKVALMKMSERIDKSLRVLAEIKNAELKTTISQEDMNRLEWENSVVPPNMDTPITVKWVGGAEQPLQMISDYVGYQFKSGDKKPINPVVVSVNSVAKPAIDIVRDIATQLGDAGTVKILPGPKIILLNFGDKEYLSK